MRWFRTCGDLDANDPRFVQELMRRNRCAECWNQGCDNRQRLEFDHIVAMRAGGERLDPLNVQPLCHRHHSAKTMRESVNAGK